MSHLTARQLCGLGGLVFAAVAAAGGEPPAAATAAAEPVVATAISDPVAALARAREVQLRRQPREAIPLFVEVIEQSRSRLEVAAPAVIHLVECFQMLRGDLPSEQRYRSVIGKYLSTPPALDGHSLPTLDLVKEDLLWKPWEPGRTSRFRFTVQSIDETRQIVGGVRQSTVQVTLGAETGPDGPRLIEDHGALSAVQPAPDGKAEVPADHLIVRDATGAVVAWDDASKDLRWQPTVRLRFDALPPSVREFASITGTLRMRQVKDSVVREIGLRPGATWAVDGTQGTVKACGPTADGFELDLEIRATGTKAEAVTEGVVTAAASGGTAGDGDDVATSPDAELALPGGLGICDAQQRPLRARSYTSGGDGGTHRIHVVFGARAKPAILRYVEVTAISTRDVPFTVTSVKLP